MAVKRTAHAVYDAKYHLVWAPKYRRWVEREDIRRRIGELFEEIAVNRGLDIDTMEVAADRVHVVVSFPPKHSISHVVSLLKSVSASVLFREYPEVKEVASEGV
jgi:putative transposase